MLQHLEILAGLHSKCLGEFAPNINNKKLVFYILEIEIHQMQAAEKGQIKATH